MALSFLSQNSGLLDLQSIFDPQYTHHQQQQQQQLHLSHHPQHHIQQHQNQQLQQQAEQIQQHQQERTLSTKFDLNLFNELDQMEFNNLNRSQYQNNNNNNSISNNQNSNNNTNTTNGISENLNQVSFLGKNQIYVWLNIYRLINNCYWFSSGRIGITNINRLSISQYNTIIYIISFPQCKAFLYVIARLSRKFEIPENLN